MADRVEPDCPGGPADSTQATAHPARVFISYSSHDAALAQSVCSALEVAGFSCWIAPRDVVPGKLYADGIVRAINDSMILVVVLSEHAIASTHVGKELERATSKRHPIIALRIDAASLTPAFEYFLGESQWIEVGAVGADAAIRKLIDAARAHLVPESVVKAGDRGSATELVAQHSVASPPRAKHSQNLSRSILVLGALIALVVAYLATDKLWLTTHVVTEPPIAATAPTSTPTAAAITDKSVGVLPFIDMSETKDQEYFSDGLSEELIDMLTKVPDLQVPARTSSFYFKGKQTNVGEIGKALGVAHVLEGSVRKSGNVIRITAQLIRVSNGYHLWSETYDRKLDDIFKIQDDIANAVVQALKASLLEGSAPMAARTANAEAYTFFLQAESISKRWNTPSDFRTAVGYIERAIKLDPSYAPAWALLSAARSAQAGESPLPSEERWTEARIAAEKAISLAPGDAAGYCAMAKINWLHDWDWVGSQTQIQRALETNQGCGLTWGGYLAMAMGDFDKGMNLLKLGAKRDPLNSYMFLYLGIYQVFAGRLSDARITIDKVLALNPAVPVNGLKGLILLEEHNPAAAFQEFDHDSDPAGRLFGRAISLHALGRRSESDSALRNLEEGYSKSRPFDIATAHAFRGDADRAFEWLDRAYTARDIECVFVKINPLLREIHSDPRFNKFLRKMKLPE
jgi:TolB-like protein